MDLTRQPPRRPSNVHVGGIAGLARMIDKARGHNEETIGEFKYGADSGLDVEVLEFIKMSADEFAEAVDEMDDRALGKLALAKAQKTRDEVDAFNKEHLERAPQDELHEQLLVERIAKFAPERTDIKTVFASIELDDWGAFRDLDLIVAPPRSPYVRSVFGLVGAARMADKARAVTIGKLGDYRYGGDSSQDQAILDFIGVDQEAFRAAAYQNPNDAELSEWIAERCEKTAAAKSAFNAGRASVGRYGEMHERLVVRRAEVAPERGDLETFFDLQDLDDELGFGLMDLRRHPPRSPFDQSVGGMVCLARMIDKFRALNCNCMGEYWCGEDSGFDRRILEFLGLAQEEFAAAVKEQATDEAVVAWLGERLSGKSDEERAQFNEKILTLGPSNDRQWNFLRGAVARLDPSRTDIETFAALTLLDDKVYFARCKAGV
ncbi:MAG: DUF5069 domain-containing protein [Candidatus Latescibacterota bacterium]|nr:DUF5069 domain-containing protein [Candidatus Latescibacterota bacterium]